MSRGMKKFLPFASLKEQAIFLHEMEKNKEKVPKPQISEDTISEINHILSAYSGETLVIYYFANGFIKSITTTIKRIDVINKTLRLEAFSIKFTNILNIEIV